MASFLSFARASLGGLSEHAKRLVSSFLQICLVGRLLRSFSEHYVKLSLSQAVFGLRDGVFNCDVINDRLSPLVQDQDIRLRCVRGGFGLLTWRVPWVIELEQLYLTLVVERACSDVPLVHPEGVSDEAVHDEGFLTSASPQVKPEAVSLLAQLGDLLVRHLTLVGLDVRITLLVPTAPLGNHHQRSGIRLEVKTITVTETNSSSLSIAVEEVALLTISSGRHHLSTLPIIIASPPPTCMSHPAISITMKMSKSKLNSTEALCAIYAFVVRVSGLRVLLDMVRIQTFMEIVAALPSASQPAEAAATSFRIAEPPPRHPSCSKDTILARASQHVYHCFSVSHHSFDVGASTAEHEVFETAPSHEITRVQVKLTLFCGELHGEVFRSDCETEFLSPPTTSRRRDLLLRIEQTVLQSVRNILTPDDTSSPPDFAHVFNVCCKSISLVPVYALATFGSEKHASREDDDDDGFSSCRSETSSVSDIDEAPSFFFDSARSQPQRHAWLISPSQLAEPLLMILPEQLSDRVCIAACVDDGNDKYTRPALLRQPCLHVPIISPTIPEPRTTYHAESSILEKPSQELAAVFCQSRPWDAMSQRHNTLWVAPLLIDLHPDAMDALTAVASLLATPGEVAELRSQCQQGSTTSALVTESCFTAWLTFIRIHLRPLGALECSHAVTDISDVQLLYRALDGPPKSLTISTTAHVTLYVSLPPTRPGFDVVFSTVLPPDIISCCATEHLNGGSAAKRLKVCHERVESDTRMTASVECVSQQSSMSEWEPVTSPFQLNTSTDGDDTVAESSSSDDVNDIHVLFLAPRIAFHYQTDLASMACPIWDHVEMWASDNFPGVATGTVFTLEGNQISVKIDVAQFTSRLDIRRPTLLQPHSQQEHSLKFCLDEFQGSLSFAHSRSEEHRENKATVSLASQINSLVCGSITLSFSNIYMGCIKTKATKPFLDTLAGVQDGTTAFQLRVSITTEAGTAVVGNLSSLQIALTQDAVFFIASFIDQIAANVDDSSDSCLPEFVFPLSASITVTNTLISCLPADFTLVTFSGQQRVTAALLALALCDTTLQLDFQSQYFQDLQVTLSSRAPISLVVSHTETATKMPAFAERVLRAVESKSNFPATEPLLHMGPSVLHHSWKRDTSQGVSRRVRISIKWLDVLVCMLSVRLITDLFASIGMFLKSSPPPVPLELQSLDIAVAVKRIDVGLSFLASESVLLSQLLSTRWIRAIARLVICGFIISRRFDPSKALQAGLVERKRCSSFNFQIPTDCYPHKVAVEDGAAEFKRTKAIEILDLVRRSRYRRFLKCCPRQVGLSALSLEIKEFLFCRSTPSLCLSTQLASTRQQSRPPHHVDISLDLSPPLSGTSELELSPPCDAWTVLGDLIAPMVHGGEQSNTTSDSSIFSVSNCINTNAKEAACSIDWTAEVQVDLEPIRITADQLFLDALSAFSLRLSHATLTGTCALSSSLSTLSRNTTTKGDQTLKTKPENEVSLLLHPKATTAADASPNTCSKQQDDHEPDLSVHSLRMSDVYIFIDFYPRRNRSLVEMYSGTTKKTKVRAASVGQLLVTSLGGLRNLKLALKGRTLKGVPLYGSLPLSEERSNTVIPVYISNATVEEIPFTLLQSLQGVHAWQLLSIDFGARVMPHMFPGVWPTSVSHSIKLARDVAFHLPPLGPLERVGSSAKTLLSDIAALGFSTRPRKGSKRRHASGRGEWRAVGRSLGGFLNQCSIETIGVVVSLVDATHKVLRTVDRHVGHKQRSPSRVLASRQAIARYAEQPFGLQNCLDIPLEQSREKNRESDEGLILLEKGSKLQSSVVLDSTSPSWMVVENVPPHIPTEPPPIRETIASVYDSLKTDFTGALAVKQRHWSQRDHLMGRSSSSSATGRRKESSALSSAALIVPILLVKPLLGVVEVLSVTLRTVRQSLDPEHAKSVAEVVKLPNIVSQTIYDDSNDELACADLDYADNADSADDNEDES